MPRRRFASLETFVAGDTNRLAIASAEMVVRQPGQLTPLMFHGPTSVGKTHLLEGIWTAARKKHQRLTAVYLSAEQFTSHFLEALRGSGLPSFRRKYRGVGVLIIDDLQFFVGKRATQVELLHTVDTFLREGRQLVFAADRSPAELAELGPELTTRLTSGLVCRIEPPDYATRLGIIGQMARRMKIHVPADVREFIASRLTSHARELSGALCRLQATSESLGRPISLAMAEEALADLIRHSGRAGAAARHREGRLRRFRPGAGQPAIRRQAESGEPSADVGHVACPQAHPRRLERDRPLFRPPQPQHGDFGPEAGGRLDGLRPTASTWPSTAGRSTTPSARSSAAWRPGKRFRTCGDSSPLSARWQNARELRPASVHRLALDFCRGLESGFPGYPSALHLPRGRSCSRMKKSTSPPECSAISTRTTSTWPIATATSARRSRNGSSTRSPSTASTPSRTPSRTTRARSSSRSS